MELQSKEQRIEEALTILSNVLHDQTFSQKDIKNLLKTFIECYDAIQIEDSILQQMGARIYRKPEAVKNLDDMFGDIEDDGGDADDDDCDENLYDYE